MSRLQRTQIYLPADLTEELDRVASRRNTSRAELLRQAAREFLEREPRADEDPILAVVGLGDAGPGAVSEEHDRFLATVGASTASR
jgi:predicted transcriptional regulator